jgi:rRNA maturation endonuclease Nob1
MGPTKRSEKEQNGTPDQEKAETNTAKEGGAAVVRTCPGCDKTFETPMDQVQGDEITCPSCGLTFDLDASDFTKIMGDWD